MKTVSDLREVEVEKWILGVVISTWEYQKYYMRMLTLDDFTEPLHRDLYECIEKGINENRFIDLSVLHTKFELKDLFGLGKYPSANPKVWCLILRSLNIRRKGVAACNETILSLCTKDIAHEDTLEKLSLQNIELSKLNNSSEALTNRDIIDQVDKLLEKSEARGGILGERLFGIKKLDTELGGCEESDLILVAGRPGMGKSVVAINILVHAIRTNKRIILWSLEMDARQVVLRVLSGLGGGNYTDLKQGIIKDKNAYERAKNEYISSRVKIFEQGGVSISQISNAIITEHEKEPIDGLVIDHLAIVSGSSSNRYEGQTEVSNKSKALAKNLKRPVIGLLQLSRGPESRTNKRPTMSDLRDTGAYEQDADKVIGVYRDQYYNTDAGDESELIILKNRSGQTCTCIVEFEVNKMMFQEPKTDYFKNIPNEQYPTLSGVDYSDQNPF